MAIKSLKDLNLENKSVLVRVDYNTPIKNEEVADDSRIRASLPTLNYLLERNCQITLMSHLGRPKGQVNMAYTLKPVVKRLAELIGQEVTIINDLEPRKERNRVCLLENLRFHPGETKNDVGLAKKLSQFGEVYINDAFGSAHRAHASIEAIAHLFSQKGAGFLLEKEIHYLRDSLKDPARPYMAILGGSKVSDKIKLVENLIDKVDIIAIGGAMSYTFLAAQGIEVGNSRVEPDFMEGALHLIEKAKKKNVQFLLPLDHLIADQFSEETEAKITLDQAIEKDNMGLDIGPETINLYTSTIRKAKTVVWNGPMGVFEWDTYSTGTISIAETLAVGDCLSIVGGGDSVAAVNKAQVAHKMDHISTGGGASLELLSGIELPGFSALEED